MTRNPAQLAALLVAVGTIIAELPGGIDASAAEIKKAHVGETLVVELEGNPSTGYRWRLDTSGSRNVGILKIEDEGYGESPPSADGKRRVGTPASHIFRITALAPGSAMLNFEYVRPWVGKPSKFHELAIEVQK